MDKSVKWKNLGSTFRMRGGKKIVKPNEVFSALESEIPQAFRDIIVPVEPLPDAEVLEISPGGYSLRHRGANWYDILDPQGKVVNEKALRQDEARKMLDDLGVPVVTRDEAAAEGEKAPAEEEAQPQSESKEAPGE